MPAPPKGYVRGSSSPNSPGFFGALKDAAQAIMDTGKDGYSGRGGRERDAQIQQEVDDDSTGNTPSAKLGKMKAAQSTDNDNGYQF